MAASYQSPMGMPDLLPEDVYTYRRVEEIARNLLERAGYLEIRTPHLEYVELFQRGVGEGTDIVEKEMYTFQGSEGKVLALRPEQTASVFRAYLQHDLHKTQQFRKFFYLGPMFRHERPQAGRLRQFHQMGMEVIGASNPWLDAEVIALTKEFFEQVGLTKFQILLNSIGCPNCRPAYVAKLRDYYRPHLAALCGNCQRRFEKNALRLLDCKVEPCQPVKRGTPKITDHLCAECAGFHQELKKALGEQQIPFTEDPMLVRGFDYYTKTVFEFIHPDLGARSSICGGGRYDVLSEALGGPPLPAVGVAPGIETTLLALDKERKKANATAPNLVPRLDVYGASVDASAFPHLFRLVQELRKAGISADLDYEGRSLKAQMRMAGRLEARFVAIAGPDEVKAGQVKLKNMQTGEEALVAIADVAPRVRPASH